MISCVVLAAGESRRFGPPKALADLGGTTAIETIQRTLIASSVGEVIIVLGAHQNLIEPHVFNHKKVKVVHNKNYKLGQASSFQAGVASVDKNSGGFMLWPVDCPWIAASAIEELARTFEKDRPRILVPVFNGRRGHPPVFNASLKKEILDLPVSEGLNALFTRYPPQEMQAKDEGVVKTFNTPQELSNVKKSS